MSEDLVLVEPSDALRRPGAASAELLATMLAYGERRLLTFDQDDFHRYHDRIEPVDPTVNA